MTVRPILFSAPMVRALLDGSKTQARRMMKPQPVEGDIWPGTYGPGDLLWVRESWQCWPKDQHVLYAATDPEPHGPFPIWSNWAFDGKFRWQSSTHMPRHASRLTLEITGIKVERVQDITEADAKAEGVVRSIDLLGAHEAARMAYSTLWNSIYGSNSWTSNPWVYALTFTVHQANVDAFLASAEREPA